MKQLFALGLILASNLFAQTQYSDQQIDQAQQISEKTLIKHIALENTSNQIFKKVDLFPSEDQKQYNNQLADYSEMTSKLGVTSLTSATISGAMAANNLVPFGKSIQKATPFIAGGFFVLGVSSLVSNSYSTSSVSQEEMADKILQAKFDDEEIVAKSISEITDFLVLVFDINQKEAHAIKEEIKRKIIQAILDEDYSTEDKKIKIDMKSILKNHLSENEIATFVKLSESINNPDTCASGINFVCQFEAIHMYQAELETALYKVQLSDKQTKIVKANLQLIDTALQKIDFSLNL